MPLTVQDVVDAARYVKNPDYERGLLRAVAKGYRARRNRQNPYRMGDYWKAWQLGFDNKHESLEEVEQCWLQIRKGDRRWGEPPPQVQPDMATAAPKREAIHPDDLKAHGYNVTKSEDGSWLVCKEVTQPVSVSAQPAQKSVSSQLETKPTARIIPFPSSRIVRRIIDGKPADSGAVGDAA